MTEHIQSYFIIDTDPNTSINQLEDDFLRNHPQGTVDLMFALTGGIRLGNFKGDQFLLSQIFVMAQQEGFFEIDFGQQVRIAGVVFNVESFSKLFNFPMSELTNKGCAIQDELGESYHELHDRLFHSTDEQIPDFLNRFFITELANVDYSFTQFDQLIRWMRSSQDRHSVQELAGLANMSEKTLQRHMKSVTGVSPKSYSNIIRFNSVLKLMDQEVGKMDWQDILFRAGYFDQAHFIKDFKRFTGVTPTQFLKENENLSKLFLKD